uniref:Uncharacterized protein n=1 Tax=Anopheles atroparvus TaxID=41427 RepID=A0AAG5DR90_ANOAO
WRALLSRRAIGGRPLRVTAALLIRVILAIVHAVALPPVWNAPIVVALEHPIVTALSGPNVDAGFLRGRIFRAVAGAAGIDRGTVLLVAAILAVRLAIAVPRFVDALAVADAREHPRFAFVAAAVPLVRTVGAIDLRVTAPLIRQAQARRVTPEFVGLALDARRIFLPTVLLVGAVAAIVFAVAHPARLDAVPVVAREFVCLAVRRLAVLLVASVLAVIIEVAHEVLGDAVTVHLAREHVRRAGRFVCRASFLVAVILAVIIAIASVTQWHAQRVGAIEKLRAAGLTGPSASILLLSRSSRTGAPLSDHFHAVRTEARVRVLRPSDAHVRAAVLAGAPVCACLDRVAVHLHVH